MDLASIKAYLDVDNVFFLSSEQLALSLAVRACACGCRCCSERGEEEGDAIATTGSSSLARCVEDDDDIGRLWRLALPD